MQRLVKLWAAIVHWWTHKNCTTCGEEYHKKDLFSFIYLSWDGKHCRKCISKRRKEMDDFDHEQKVKEEMKTLRAKQEARARFEAEQEASYRKAAPKVRVEEESHPVTVTTGSKAGHRVERW